MHDYGYSKRIPMYYFMAKHLGLSLDKVTDSFGKISELDYIILLRSSLEVFPEKNYPTNMVKSCEAVQALINNYK